MHNLAIISDKPEVHVSRAGRGDIYDELMVDLWISELNSGFKANLNFCPRANSIDLTMNKRGHFARLNRTNCEHE